MGMALSKKRIGNTEAIFGGSGGPAYADATEVHAPDNERTENDATAIFARSIGQLVSELTTNDTLDQHYGGWIEFTVFRGDHFSKEKYALKLWYLNNKRKQYSPGPLIFNFYRNHTLIVAKFSYETHGDQKARELYEVSDMFGRTSPKPDDGPNVEFDPAAIFHVVIDTEANHVDTFRTAGDNMGYEVVVDKDFNIAETINPRFWDIITGKTPSPGMWIVT